MAAPLSTIRLTHLLSFVRLRQSWQFLVILRWGLLINLLVVAVLVVAPVFDPGGTVCCHSALGCAAVPVICLTVGVNVVNRHSALFGHVSWLSTSVASMSCMFSFCSFSYL